jgi:hypothetical protein
MIGQVYSHIGPAYLSDVYLLYPVYREWQPVVNACGNGLGQYGAKTPDNRLFAGIDNINAGEGINCQYTQEQTKKRFSGFDVAERPRYILQCGVIFAEKTSKPFPKRVEKEGYQFFNPH